MTFDPERHHRRSIRLPTYDYRQAGAYFVTAVLQDRLCLFGDVVGGEMRLNDAGAMAQGAWDSMAGHYPGVTVDTSIVMPNHTHAIIVLVGAAPRGRPGSKRVGDAAPGQARGPAPTLSLPDVMHRFKTLTTRRYTEGVRHRDWPAFRNRLWQRNYYEHIVRDEESLHQFREYIATNPQRWALDDENPDRPRPQRDAASP